MSSDKVNEILAELHAHGERCYTRDAKHLRPAQARAQIIDWALEIVGEDEPEGRDCDYEGGDPASDRNDVRRELRAKLTEKRNG